MYQGGLRGPSLWGAYPVKLFFHSYVLCLRNAARRNALCALYGECICVPARWSFPQATAKAGVSCRCYKVFCILHCTCPKEFHKSGLLLHKEQPAEAQLQQHLSLTGRLKKACRRVHNCGAVIIEGSDSWCRFRHTEILKEAWVAAVVNSIA